MRRIPAEAQRRCIWSDTDKAQASALAPAREIHADDELRRAADHDQDQARSGTGRSNRLLMTAVLKMAVRFILQTGAADRTVIEGRA